MRAALITTLLFTAVSGLVSDPALNPAKLLVTINDADKVYDGYLFSAPNRLIGQANGDGSGAHIYKKDGTLLWSSKESKKGASFQNFCPINDKAASYYIGSENGGHGYGSYKIIDSSYRVVDQFGQDADIHEGVKSKDTELFDSYETVQTDLTAAGGPKGGYVYQGTVTEQSATTKKPFFTWRSIDHVPVTESVQALTGSSKTSPYDYFHLNAIFKDENGNYLVSARHTWSLYYIDGSDGHIRWTANSNSKGALSNWDIDDNALFAFQHNVERVDPKLLGRSTEPNTWYISIFDNEGITLPRFIGKNAPSRGLILKFQTYNNRDITADGQGKIGRVTLVHEYRPPVPQTISWSQGSVHVLPNGNVLVGWGSYGGVTEFTLEGKAVFHATLLTFENIPDVFQSYRWYKGHWSPTTPKTNPSLVASSSGKNTSIHVSWNGANVSSYEVFAGNTQSNLTHVATLQGEDFEVSQNLSKTFNWVKVVAHDGDKKELSSVVQPVVIKRI